MDSVWSALPDSLAFHVISFMSIDTRLFFGVLPGRLPKSSLKISPAVTKLSSKMFTARVDVSPGKVYNVIVRHYPFYTNIYSWTCVSKSAYSSGFFSENSTGIISSFVERPRKTREELIAAVQKRIM